MGDGFAAEFANGKKNVWGERIEFLEPESEHSSATTCEGFALAGGRDDVMGVADCGWGMLFGRNAQEAADLALIARRVAEDTETTFFNVQDSFLSTHTLESVLLPEPELMHRCISHPESLRRLFDPNQVECTGRQSLGVIEIKPGPGGRRRALRVVKEHTYAELGENSLAGRFLGALTGCRPLRWHARLPVPVGIDLAPCGAERFPSGGHRNGRHILRCLA